MSNPWDSDELWVKAKLFINRAIDASENKTFDERALWAVFSLELLAKAALSRASPLLIATPNEDGKNLLAAAGLIDDAATFKTITARTLFQRCGKAFKPFNSEAAANLAEDRNGYLHSANAGVSQIPEAAWWPRFWALTVVLINACDQDLEAFVGSSQVASVESQLARNRENVEHRLAMILERARQRLARFQAGEMRESERRDWERRTDLDIGCRYSASTTCPACESEDGMLEGDEVVETQQRVEQVGPDDFDVWLELEIASEHFSCPICRCVLDSFELLQASGLPETIDAIGDPADFWEPDYGND